MVYCTNLQKRVQHRFLENINQNTENTIIISDYRDVLSTNLNCINYKSNIVQIGVHSNLINSIYTIDYSGGSLTNLIHNIQFNY